MQPLGGGKIPLRLAHVSPEQNFLLKYQNAQCPIKFNFLLLWLKIKIPAAAALG